VIHQLLTCLEDFLYALMLLLSPNRILLALSGIVRILMQSRTRISTLQTIYDPTVELLDREYKAVGVILAVFDEVIVPGIRIELDGNTAVS